MNRLISFLKEYSGALFGLILTALGLLGTCYLSRDGVWHSLSETAIVAGIVTFAVDPFLKRRLIKEASKDIFKYLLGFDLPSQIRDAIYAQLFSISTFRSDAHLDVNVETSGEEVLVTVNQRAKVIALKDNSSFRQGLACEVSERATLLSAVVSGHRDCKHDYDKTSSSPALKLADKKDEPMVLEWKGPEIRLQAGEQLDSCLRYEMRRSRFDHAVFNFGAPTIRPSVHVSCSDDLEITASLGTRQTGNTYTYDRVFLVGDHLLVRWKPKQV